MEINKKEPIKRPKMEVSVWSHQLPNINDKFGQEDEDQISIRFSGVIVIGDPDQDHVQGE